MQTLSYTVHTTPKWPFPSPRKCCSVVCIGPVLDMQDFRRCARCWILSRQRVPRALLKADAFLKYQYADVQAMCESVARVITRQMRAAITNLVHMLQVACH